VTRRDERAVTIPLEGGPDTLEGIYVAGSGAGAAVIAPPHPLYGGSMDSPVLNELAWACGRQGLASLRFNWRGVGASARAPSGDSGDADADYASALEHLKQTLPGSLLACGYSFGAAAAVRVGVREPRVDRLVLVSPPPALLDNRALETFSGSILILTGEADPIAPPGPLESLRSAVGGVRLEVVPEADHFFASGLAEISRRASTWLEQPAA
jgi:alpha/beta superfamily hydrolase